MFCPNCRNELPEGAKFCGKCGAKLDNRRTPAAAPAHAAAPAQQAAPTINGNAPMGGAPMGGTPRPVSPMPAQPAPGRAMNMPPKSNFSVMAIVTLVVGIIAIVASFMPWLEFNSTFSSFTSGLSSVGSALGISGSKSVAFDSSYSPMGFMSLAQTASAWAGSDYGTVIMMDFAGWLVGVILLVAGLIMSVVRKGKSFVLTLLGCIILAVAAIACVIVLGQVFKSLATIGTGAYMCVLFCIITLVCSIVMRATAK